MGVVVGVGVVVRDDDGRVLAEETTLQAEAVTVVGMGLTHREGYGPGWTVAVLADDVAGEPRVAAPHEFATLDWFAEDGLPEPLFGPTRYVLDAVAGRARGYTVTAR